MFLRFVTQKSISGLKAREGIFAAAYDLKRNGILTSVDDAHLTEILEWFKQNLTVPKRSNRTTSKDYYRRTTTGIAWFKSSATKHLAKIRELAELLDRYEYRSEILKSERRGYVIYEDDVQIIAEPFHDTRA